jgi:hypothetical protein
MALWDIWVRCGNDEFSCADKNQGWLSLLLALVFVWLLTAQHGGIRTKDSGTYTLKGD